MIGKIGIVLRDIPRVNPKPGQCVFQFRRGEYRPVIAPQVLRDPEGKQWIALGGVTRADEGELVPTEACRLADEASEPFLWIVTVPPEAKPEDKILMEKIWQHVRQHRARECSLQQLAKETKWAVDVVLQRLLSSPLVAYYERRRSPQKIYLYGEGS